VASSRATTSRPLVPLSSRWTIPGRAGSAPPPRIPASSSTRVVPACEGAGWTTRPAGLSTTARESSRWTMRSCSATPGLALGFAQVDQDQQDDAEGDRRVGQVEGRPGGQVDEVGDRAGAHAVEQVAEGAAGEQPGRHPHPGPRRVAGEEIEDDG